MNHPPHPLANGLARLIDAILVRLCKRVPASRGAVRPRRRDCHLVALAVLLGASLCTGAAGAALRIEITGLPEALEENVRLSVGEPLDERERTLERFIDSLPERTNRALAALGYFSADIDIDRRTEEVGEDDEDEEGDEEREDGGDGNGDGDRETVEVVTIDVEPNDPVRIERISLRIDGEARLDGSYMSAIAGIPLRRGRVFVSGDYERTKSVLLDRAQRLGYFDFQFTANDVRVSRRQLSADITLTADSGPRYTFGEIVFDTDALGEEFLSRWVPFEEGDPYQADFIAELTRNLQRSGYFQSVRVAPQRDRRYGRVVPVRVTLQRRPENEVGLGIGFSTDDEGIRGKVTWDKPLLNSRGHSLSTALSLSAVRQSASFSYRIPRGTRPLLNYYAIEYGLRNRDRDDDGVESFLSTLNFQRVSRRRHDWDESVFLRWERETYTVGGIEETTDLVLPGISYTRTRSKGEPFPTWGQATAFQFLYGSRALLSTIDFYKSTVSFKYLREVFPRSTLIGSLQYGAISTNDFERVPVSQRFFAGGDRSIRGYKFRDISPRNPEGDAVGGRYLEILSAEYNYRFADRWSAAVFIDTGRAFNNFDQAYASGAGVGVRWQSPVGPFRIDVAHPVGNNPLDRGVRLHLSLGPDL